MAQILGGIAAAITLSRLILWLMKGWDGGLRKLLLANLFSLTFAIALFTVVDGHFDGSAISAYVIGQAVCVLGDLLIFWRRRSAAGKPGGPTAA